MTDNFMVVTMLVDLVDKITDSKKLRVSLN